MAIFSKFKNCNILHEICVAKYVSNFLTMITHIFTEILDERDLGFEEMDEDEFKQEYEDPHLRKISANGIKIEKVYD